MRSIYKKSGLLFIFVYMLLQVRAQQNHFIYLQTENKQPFYVKLDKKILSSSAAGYLIIPKLQDGTYNLTLGFPKNEWPEQKVTCRIDKKDAGYVIKNFGDKGWGLFNWQTMDVVMADSKTADTVAVTEVKKEDTVVKTAPPVTEQPKQPVAEETQKQETVKPVTVTKILNNRSADGIEMMFTDRVSGVTDTIRVFIPADKKTTAAPAIPKEEPVNVPAPKEEKPAESPAQPVVVQEQKPVIQKDTVAVELPRPADVPVKPAAIPKTEEQVKEQGKQGIQNSDCKALASDDDFMKLRKKMAAENNDDDMVAAAKKAFKSKCFTVEQVKNLAVLFLNDNGRYKFFDAAYPFVSDSYNFNSLQSLLSDEYYITRFKAMIRH